MSDGKESSTFSAATIMHRTEIFRNRMWINANQCTVSRVVWRVTGALMEVYPNSFVIRETSKHVFYHRYQLPNILGCINGTHIQIVVPPAHLHPEEYINWKNVYPINVQAICDADCIFTDIVVAWSGSVHDSRIFKSSGVYGRLVTGELNGILLVDNGYGLTPFCLTPFLNLENQAKGITI